MARKLRLEFPGAIYHLMSRGDRREDIFRDDFDRECFLATLATACEKTTWQVHAFCLMRNHFHLVVETPLPNLVTGMKWFLGTYTMRFNRRHTVVGHLFSGRYRSQLVGGKGGYLRTVCEYVLLNPVRAGIIGPAEPLRRYRWSSLPLLLQDPGTRPSWLRAERLMGEFGIPRDSTAGRRELERILENRREADLKTEFDGIRSGWCIGDEAFRQELVQQAETRMGPHHYGSEVREAAEAKAERIIAEELAKIRWSDKYLESSKKGEPRKIAIARRLRDETTMTLDWISNRLGMGTRTHLSHLLYWRQRTKPTPQKAAPRRAPTRQHPLVSTLDPVEELPVFNRSIHRTDPMPVEFDTSFD